MSRKSKVESRKRWPWLVYGLLALAVVAPLLRPGYVLTLDMVFTPKLAAPTMMSNNYLWQWLLHLVNLAIPSQIIEKLTMLAILAGSGVGMHRLVESIKYKAERPTKLATLDFSLGTYFGGLFYVANPWTYERWMAGHYLLLAGYAVLPWFYRSLVELLEYGGTSIKYKVASRKFGDRGKLSFILSTFYFLPQPVALIVECGLLFCLIAILSLHMAVLAGLLGAITVVVYLVRRPRTEQVKLAKYLIGLVAGSLVLSSYWLVGLLAGTSTAAKQIASFSARDLQAFTTATGRFGLIVNVLGGYGFWLERYQRYVRPNQLTVNFVIGFVAIGILVALGLRRLWGDQKRLTVSLVLTRAVSLVFAAGIHAPLTGGLVKLLLLHVPGLRGFREPEKFGALVVFTYAILAAAGVDALMLAWRRRYGVRLVTGLLLLVPFIYMPTMLWGFNNQLRPVEYPASWTSFNDSLSPGSYRVLFLPWHEYMSFDFEPRIIASPAPSFFYNARVLSGDNAEFGDVVRDLPNPTSDAVESALENHSDGQLAAKLAKLNVKYVLLANGYDVRQYQFLTSDSGLTLVSTKPGLIVWQNQRYSGGRP